jgi:mono/diheme cytochrome c family protein
MSAEPNQPMPNAAEASEPKAGLKPLPIWLFVLLFLLLYWGMVYFDQHSGWFNSQVYTPYHSFAQLQACQPATGGVDLQRGKTVYENVCALCHNTDGNGKPGQAPPFVGSEWVTGSPTRMIHIPLTGLSGPLSVAGKEWNLAMPAMGAALSDEDLAATLTYIRATFGNKASAISSDQVKAVRAKLAGRTQPSTAAELNSVQ